MKKARRPLLLACAGIVSLAWCCAALALYTPRLTVSHATQNVGGSGPVTLRVSQSDQDDATAKVTMYVPEAYPSKLNQAAGTQLGTVRERFVLKALGGGKVSESGTLKADNPAVYTTNAQLAADAKACTGTSVHTAVWIASVTLNGQPLDLTLYVDQVTAPPETSFGVLKVQFCPRSPDLPLPLGSPSGAQLIEASFTVNGVFKYPKLSGSYSFKTLFTPYLTGTGTVNQAGTVESQAIIALPVQLTLGAKVATKGRVVLSGVLTTNLQGVGGAPIKLFAGPTRGNVKRIKMLRTNARGGYRVVVRVKRTTYFATRTTVLARNLGSSNCTPTLTTVPCVSQTLAPFSVRNRLIVKVVVRRR